MWFLLIQILEFLIGWIIVPKIFVIVVILLLAYFGFPESQKIIYVQLGKLLLMIVLLFMRRVLALGYLANYALDILGIDISLEKVESWFHLLM